MAGLSMPCDALVDAAIVVVEQTHLVGLRGTHVDRCRHVGTERLAGGRHPFGRLVARDGIDCLDSWRVAQTAGTEVSYESGREKARLEISTTCRGAPVAIGTSALRSAGLTPAKLLRAF